jgi:hypothetical protein
MANRVAFTEFPCWIQRPPKRLPHLFHHQHHEKCSRKREPENPDFDIFYYITSSACVQRLLDKVTIRLRLCSAPPAPSSSSSFRGPKIQMALTMVSPHCNLIFPPRFCPAPPFSLPPTSSSFTYSTLTCLLPDTSAFALLLYPIVCFAFLQFLFNFGANT